MRGRFVVLPMDEQEFYDRVERRASFESEGEARDLADDLPRPIAESLTHHHGNPAALSLAEFVERIEGHDEVDADLGERDERVAAVLGTLAEAAVEGFDDLRDQLPSEFEELIESAGTEREVEN